MGKLEIGLLADRQDALSVSSDMLHFRKLDTGVMHICDLLTTTVPWSQLTTEMAIDLDADPVNILLFDMYKCV